MLIQRHADETMFALAHEFPNIDAARRTWRRIEAKAKRLPISAIACTTDGRPLVVLLADEEKDIETILKRVTLGGKPFTLDPASLAAFHLRRTRTAVESIAAGRVRGGLTDHRATYDPQSPAILGHDGRLRRSR